MKNKSNNSKQEVDLVLNGGTAITVDSERRVIRDAGIAIKGEDLVFVGKAAEVSERYQAKRTLDCSDKVMTPGLVNAHTHLELSHMSVEMIQRLSTSEATEKHVNCRENLPEKSGFASEKSARMK